MILYTKQSYSLTVFFYFYKKCGKTLEKALQKCDKLSIKVLQKGELYVKEKN